LATAVWLYTYRVWDVREYIDYIGGKRHHFRPSERVRIQPWWSVYASVAVALIGAGVSLWLLPEGRRTIRRLIAKSARPPKGFSAKPS
jgi:hypothetical protein